MNKTKHDLESVLKAIAGSSGIKTTIAQRLNVTRPTVDKYLERWVTAQEAYISEILTIADVAESVVFTNIKLAARVQQTGIAADSADAKWYLSRKVKGYSDKTEVTGEDGKPIDLRIQVVRGYDDDEDTFTPPAPRAITSSEEAETVQYTELGETGRENGARNGTSH